MPRKLLLGLCLLGSCLLALGCSSGMESAARSRYNHGIDLMAEGDLKRAETAFLDARNKARGDQMVRYAAAFNLGMLHVRKADELELSEPQKALAELEQARNWFQDAARVRSNDDDARANLQLVGRKAQVLADQLNKGKNSLEARLDRVIEDERALRDEIRELMEAVRASGTEADPIGFRKVFAGLATSERILMAEAGTVSDLASDELAGLDSQVPEEMKQEDVLRQMQLRSLDAYLQSARVAIDDTRRALRQLDGGRSHSRATAALAHLKRAREQLLDPVAALKAVAQDESLLLSHSTARFELGRQQLKMPGAEPATNAAIPAWLSAEHLAERQADALERCSEVLLRFQAATSAPPAEDPAAADPKVARSLEMALQAVPFLVATVAAMEQARTSLTAHALEAAIKHEAEAMRNLLRAIEYFSDLPNLIELTYSEQLGVVAMLDPVAAAEVPEIAEMSTDKRAQEALAATQRNIDRVGRMKALIADELAQAQQEAQQQGQEAPESAQQRHDMAEALRSSAAAKLALVGGALQGIADGDKPDPAAESPLLQAQLAQKDIEELRRLYYTIVEHLKELHRDQSETYDQTGDAQAAEDEARAAALPPLVEAQSRYAVLADALAGALEQQSDAMRASEQPEAAQEAEKFAAAAVEVRAALEAITAAAAVLSQAAEDAATMSVELGAAITEQPIALEHIQAAIEILEPPQEQEQEQEDQEPQEQEEQEQQEQQEQEEVSKQQAERRLQEIRDREAERQREREESKNVQSAGVEKDW